jgi:hypothetical protein
MAAGNTPAKDIVRPLAQLVDHARAGTISPAVLIAEAEGARENIVRRASRVHLPG